MFMKKQKIVGSKEKEESDRPSELDYCGLYIRNEFIDNEKKAMRKIRENAKSEDEKRTELVPGSFPGGLHY